MCLCLVFFLCSLFFFFFYFKKLTMNFSCNKSEFLVSITCNWYYIVSCNIHFIRIDYKISLNFIFLSVVVVLRLRRNCTFSVLDKRIRTLIHRNLRSRRCLLIKYFIVCVSIQYLCCLFGGGGGWIY